MSNTELTADIKTRVPIGWKQAFKSLAKNRFVSAANLQREAMREYLERQKKLKPGRAEA